MTKRAAAYIRVSTGRQAEGELSLPDQRRAIEAYCKDRGWPVVATYIDHVSASDENKRRPDFERMIDDGLTGRGGFNVIVVHSYSRYFRIAVQAELYHRKLKKSGIDIVSITQPFGEGSTGDMVRQIVGIFDEFQSKEIGKHVSRTMKENARQGFINGRVPFGYKAVVVEKRGDSQKKKADINKMRNQQSN
jgi:DNA invertase Pin-like site-specific DNA recombinase